MSSLAPLSDPSPETSSATFNVTTPVPSAITSSVTFLEPTVISSMDKFLPQILPIEGFSAASEDNITKGGVQQKVSSASYYCYFAVEIKSGLGVIVERNVINQIIQSLLPSWIYVESNITNADKVGTIYTTTNKGKVTVSVVANEATSSSQSEGLNRRITVWKTIKGYPSFKEGVTNWRALKEDMPRSFYAEVQADEDNHVLDGVLCPSSVKNSLVSNINCFVVKVSFNFVIHHQDDKLNSIMPKSLQIDYKKNGPHILINSTYPPTHTPMERLFKIPKKIVLDEIRRTIESGRLIDNNINGIYYVGERLDFPPIKDDNSISAIKAIGYGNTLKLQVGFFSIFISIILLLVATTKRRWKHFRQEEEDWSSKEIESESNDYWKEDCGQQDITKNGFSHACFSIDLDSMSDTTRISDNDRRGIRTTYFPDTLVSRLIHHIRIGENSNQTGFEACSVFRSDCKNGSDFHLANPSPLSPSNFPADDFMESSVEKQNKDTVDF